MKKTRDEIIAEGQQLRLYRNLMGIRQWQMAAKLGVNQGNYSKMENGRENNPDLVPKVKVMFDKWRSEEIEKLHKRIDYLRNL